MFNAKGVEKLITQNEINSNKSNVSLFGGIYNLNSSEIDKNDVKERPNHFDQYAKDNSIINSTNYQQHKNDLFSNNISFFTDNKVTSKLKCNEYLNKKNMSNNHFNPFKTHTTNIDQNNPFKIHTTNIDQNNKSNKYLWSPNIFKLSSESNRNQDEIINTIHQEEEELALCSHDSKIQNEKEPETTKIKIKILIEKRCKCGKLRYYIDESNDDNVIFCSVKCYSA